MKTKKMKKNDIIINEDGHNVSYEESENDELLEKAQNAVIDSLPERKKKKYMRNYDNRPENLQKPVSQMSREEKIEFKKWELKELIGDEEKSEEIYTENDLYQAGSFILPFIASRLPKYIPVSEDEFSKFAKVHTPLANKYAAPFGQYKDEVNGGLFWLFFFMARVNFGEESVENAQ